MTGYIGCGSIQEHREMLNASIRLPEGKISGQELTTGLPGGMLMVEVTISLPIEVV
jgi:hypothetical protein